MPSSEILHLSQGEYKVQLEIENATKEDKGKYKFVAKNEKGETTSQAVEVTEFVEEEEAKPKKDEKPKGEPPKIGQGLQSMVN